MAVPNPDNDTTVAMLNSLERELDQLGHGQAGVGTALSAMLLAVKGILQYQRPADVIRFIIDATDHGRAHGEACGQTMAALVLALDELIRALADGSAPPGVHVIELDEARGNGKDDNPIHDENGQEPSQDAIILPTSLTHKRTIH